MLLIKICNVGAFGAKKVFKIGELKFFYKLQKKRKKKKVWDGLNACSMYCITQSKNTT